jgi:acyl-CoA synthetase (AMP-forming)/AMP-acid ligase II
MSVSTIFEGFELSAKRRPDAPAVTDPLRSRTYGELYAEVCTVAGGIDRLGVRPGDHVAILMGNQGECVVAWLAAARTGVVPTVVNSALKAREVSQILQQLEPRLVIVSAALYNVASDAVSQAGIECPMVVEGELSVAGRPDRQLLAWSSLLDAPPYAGAMPSTDDPIEITFTSGTSGQTKGALFTNRAHLFSTQLAVDWFRLGEVDTSHCVVPLAHASGIRSQVLPLLFAGGHAVIGGRFSATKFWQVARELTITYFSAVEHMLIALERQPEKADDALNSVRVVYTVGEAELLARFEHRFGVRCVQPYGTTEVLVASCTPLDLREEQVREEREFTSRANYCGHPVPGVDLRIVNPGGADLEIGQPGEILVRSPGMLREYIVDTEYNASRIVDGWWRSGDLGMYGPNGSVFFVDRIGDTVKRSGELISPREIEDVLRLHPAVLNASAFAVPDPVRMQEVKAVIALRTDASATAEEIWDWCESEMASFKVPRYLEFRRELPTGPTGKVLKRELQDDASNGRGDIFDRTAR